MTPQTITGQIRALEDRLNGSLFKRVGRSLEATELGELVFRYADKMFSLSYEMLDLLNYQKIMPFSLKWVLLMLYLKRWLVEFYYL